MEIAVLLVELGDAEEGGQVGGLQSLPAPLGADGDAVLGGDEDDARLHRAQGAGDLAGEVEVAGAVEDVDLVAVEFHGLHGQGNAGLALGLFGVVVADGVAVGDLALAVDGAGQVQHVLHQRGLAAVEMAQQGDVADLFRFKAHVAALLICVIMLFFANRLIILYLS